MNAPKGKTRYILPLQRDNDDFAVYSTWERGPFNTPLLFRGTLRACIDYRARLDDLFGAVTK